MLLLILFAGFLVPCAAQPTTTFPMNPTDMSPLTTAAFTQSVHPASVLPSENVRAILETAVQSFIQLDEATLTSVIQQFSRIIQQFDPNVSLTLTVKNITRVWPRLLFCIAISWTQNPNTILLRFIKLYLCGILFHKIYTDMFPAGIKLETFRIELICFYTSGGKEFNMSTS